MKIVACNYGYFEINSYLIIDEASKQCLVLDPGGDFQAFKSELDSHGVTPIGILVTHGHFDHIDAVDALKKEYGIPVYAHANEAKTMADSKMNLSGGFMNTDIIGHADHFIEGGSEIAIGPFRMKLIEVPGHSSNSICYYFETEQIIFTGDTLFNMSIGRTDLYNGSPYDLVNNIKEKLLILPDDTKIYSGHGLSTTILREKNQNPYL